MVTAKENSGTNQSGKMIASVLQVNNIDPALISRMWIEEIALDDALGAAAVILISDQLYYLVANIPLIVMPVNGKVFSYAQLLHFVSGVTDIPTARYAILGNAFYLTFCLRVKSVPEQQMEKAIDGIKEMADVVRKELSYLINAP